LAYGEKVALIAANHLNNTGKGAEGYLCVEVLSAPNMVNSDYTTFLVDIREHSEIASNAESSFAITGHLLEIPVSWVPIVAGRNSVELSFHPLLIFCIEPSQCLFSPIGEREFVVHKWTCGVSVWEYSVIY